jgi:hypothetical protein
VSDHGPTHPASQDTAPCCVCGRQTVRSSAIVVPRFDFSKHWIICTPRCREQISRCCACGSVLLPTDRIVARDGLVACVTGRCERRLRELASDGATRIEMAGICSMLALALTPWVAAVAWAVAA